MNLLSVIVGNTRTIPRSTVTLDRYLDEAINKQDVEAESLDHSTTLVVYTLPLM
jgi:hypothetical protein